MGEAINLKPGARYLSLDVLRGLTVALMIVVNTPGSWSHVYAPFLHAEWHGFTVTDLVFPTFLFVVGNAMSFGMKKLKTLNSTDFYKKVIDRTIKIFLIGLFLNIFPFVQWVNGELVFKDFTAIRFFGVLQRIALCYFFASTIAYYFSRKTTLLISALILLFYWGIAYVFGDSVSPYSLEGNASGKLDTLLFNAKNLYKGFGIPFDPEGLLSTLPAIVNVTLGYYFGTFIQEKGNTLKTVYQLIGVGALFLVAGLAWDMFFPINKGIWSSSYVVYCVGWDLILIAVLMLIIEIWQIKKWSYFFEVFGKNPLFIFALSGMLVRLFTLIIINGENLKSIMYKVYTANFVDKTASLLFAISYMLLLWFIGYIMDKKKIYVKV